MQMGRDPGGRWDEAREGRKVRRQMPAVGSGGEKQGTLLISSGCTGNKAGERLYLAFWGMSFAKPSLVSAPRPSRLSLNTYLSFLHTGVAETHPGGRQCPKKRMNEMGHDIEAKALLRLP